MSGDNYAKEAVNAVSRKITESGRKLDGKDWLQTTLYTWLLDNWYGPFR